MEDELKRLLTGIPGPSLTDSIANAKKRIIGFNVCYVVVGVAIEDGKVLMIQEAKPSCRGKWYLPAGRMEKNESIVEGVKREVKEEAGLDFEPRALVSVETQGMNWTRFTFVGSITGGSLKTTAEADKESLQAGWFTSDVKRLPLEIPLRLKDILPLIATAVEWQKLSGPVVMPTPKCHSFTSLRIVALQDEGASYKVLQAEVQGNSGGALPVSTDHDLDGLAFWRVLSETLKSNGLSGVTEDSVEVVGVLSVEHCYQPQQDQAVGCDGVCLTVLVRCAGVGGGAWTPVQEGLVQDMLKNCVAKGTACVKLDALY